MLKTSTRETTHDGSKESRLLIGMVTNTSVLARLASRWVDTSDELRGPLLSKWGNIVGSWCVRHFQDHNEHPGSSLISYFEDWRGSVRDRALVEGVEQFLAMLSDDYASHVEDINPDLVVDHALEYMNEVRVIRLNEATAADLEVGNVKRALERIGAFIQVGRDDDGGEDVLQDEQGIRSVFDYGGEESLIPLTHGLKSFFQSELARDSFVAFQAPEKTGKTFVLMELAWLGAANRKRVAFFEVGDMSRRQITRRLLTRITGRPYRAPNGVWPYEVDWPTHIDKPLDGEFVARVTHKRKVFDEPDDPSGLAWEACRNAIRHHIKSDKPYLKLVTAPAGTVNVATIKAKLKAWEARGWEPDIIVIDYADIMAPPAGRMETRDAINATWEQLRGLSSDKHCLVLTATQASRDSYDKYAQDRRHVSEDKRKLAHVTGLVSINVTAEEKQLGVMRFSWLAAREIEFSSKRFCHVAGCLALANPFVRSVF